VDSNLILQFNQVAHITACPAPLSYNNAARIGLDHWSLNLDSILLSSLVSTLGSMELEGDGEFFKDKVLCGVFAWHEEVYTPNNINSIDIID
jgi:hypothetical protein